MGSNNPNERLDSVAAKEGKRIFHMDSLYLYRSKDGYDISIRDCDKQGCEKGASRDKRKYAVADYYIRNYTQKIRCENGWFEEVEFYQFKTTCGKYFSVRSTAMRRFSAWA